jgi:DNA-binding response OmpR family regulator
MLVVFAFLELVTPDLKGFSVEQHFIYCGAIGAHQIFRNDALRVLQVDERFVKFSQAEYFMMQLLVSGMPLSNQVLIQAVYGSGPISPHEKPLTKHIDRLRKKLLPYGLTLHRVTKFGYLLRCLEDEPTIVSTL